ncbi:MAG: gamma-glutamyltransferase family protein [Actinomycetota bacterium]|nr:gamma-glutamyltransferase family protein [Actinomycetota bacterium]
MEVLKAGGSAVDAAIAASAVLSVVYPHMAGVGGDALWLIYDHRHNRVRYLDGAGRAAADATLDRLRALGCSEIPFRGIVPATLTVPGAVASWCEAHAEYGKLPLAADLASAIGYAVDGFPVTERLAYWVTVTADQGAFNEDAARWLLPDGRAPQPHARLANPGLARTLEAVADRGRAGFYGGDIARELCRFARRHGGFFLEADFHAQHATWAEPLSGGYRGVTVYQTPPPTQGFTVLEMFNLIEPYGVGDWQFLGPDHVHFLVQAKQIAYHDRDTLLADPRFADVPLDRLLSAGYAAQRRGLINPEKAIPWHQVPSSESLAGDTVHVAVVDGEGNAVSLIHSLYGVFGSGVVAGDTGIVLQNRGAYFSLDPAHPNRLEPRKQPLHTLIASLAFRGDRLWQVFGCMGADGQPQIHLQVYTAMVDFGLNIQQAIEMPRWLSGRFALGEPRDLLNIEARYPDDTVAELERRGHVVNRWGPWNEYAGHATGITIDPTTDTRVGGADPRSDGAAIGY